MSDRAAPATLRQLLRVNVWILLALAFMLNRHRLPARMLPEFQGVDEILLRYRVTRTVLDGNPTLVVGDSALCACTLPADMICVGGASPALLTQWLRNAMRPRWYDRYVAPRRERYEVIMLWPGTAWFINYGDIATYLHDVQEMIDVARQYAGDILLIGPMPDVYELPKRRLAQEAVAALPSFGPDVAVLDLMPFERDIVHARLTQEMYGDGVHLSEAGCERLAAMLKQMGYLRNAH